ncbi:RNA polymerase sigma factor SigJ [Microlunatus parietis]|uniref:RNA polymerase sigma-70 factor (ECF subfamily) n=1 Tax=Microlunatus parietis TaxID=682979 RepID=A0A7Y9I3S1_9ACTN|nr:RNA polymerase sigma factor SigJ [Microlunatus parietis]NYE69740.1 RNA polymerase sigma-70 factor (ECF subfamily) [Microlunatus parietis]
MNDGAADAELDALLGGRRQLINIAYRLLGSLADAEDAVQDAIARWYALPAAERGRIEKPAAWLSTVTSRICLDQLRSARVRRERYVGQWLPEPLPEPAEWTDRGPNATADPADRITLDESVSMAFLVVLDALSPAERVAFVLHDVFRFSFADVAEVTGRTPGACRQLASTARRRVADARSAAAPTAQQARVVRKFRQAWQAQDLSALVGLLDPDAISTGDGGGVVPALPDPLHGAVPIARLYRNLVRYANGTTILERTVNGRPGLVAELDGVVATVFSFQVVEDRVTRIWAVRNPHKLRAWLA